MSTLYVGNAIYTILKDAPKLTVIYESGHPENSVLITGLQRYHLIQFFGYLFLIAFVMIFYLTTV